MAAVKRYCKAELNQLTKQEIDKHRIKFLSQSHLNDDDLQYNKELELYIDIRFKDLVLARYERWSHQHDDEIAVFITGIINRMGRDEFYNQNIQQAKKEIGKFVYIEIDK